MVNDLNTFDNNAAFDLNNIRFYQNLVNFSGPGSRVSGTESASPSRTRTGAIFAVDRRM